MRSVVTRSSLFLLLCSVTLHGADEPAPKTKMKDILKARIAEDAKKAEPKKTAPAPNKDGSPVADNPAPTKSEPNPTPSPEPVAKSPATVLPRVEVKKDRITELDQRLAKQEQDIARERKNLKVSEVDSALNDSKLAKPLSIFGGESAQFRQNVASERVQLMEAEKDILEAMKRVKTKAEKQELQKQLDELKAVRRELEKSMR